MDEGRPKPGDDHRAGHRPRIFLQQKFGQSGDLVAQGRDLGIFLVQLISQGLLNLLDIFFARSEGHRRFENLIADQAESLSRLGAVRVAAFLSVILLAFGAKFDDSPYRTCDRDYSAAEP